MKRQNMLEWFNVLVSGPDCFCRALCVSVCVSVRSSIALWVLHVSTANNGCSASAIFWQYSHNNIPEKYITITVYTHQQAQARPVVKHARTQALTHIKIPTPVKLICRISGHIPFRAAFHIHWWHCKSLRIKCFPQNLTCKDCAPQDYHQLEIKKEKRKGPILYSIPCRSPDSSLPDKNYWGILNPTWLVDTSNTNCVLCSVAKKKELGPQESLVTFM